jgi:hypothetical protein
MTDPAKLPANTFSTRTNGLWASWIFCPLTIMAICATGRPIHSEDLLPSGTSEQISGSAASSQFLKASTPEEKAEQICQAWLHSAELLRTPDSSGKTDIEKYELLDLRSREFIRICEQVLRIGTPKWWRARCKLQLAFIQNQGTSGPLFGTSRFSIDSLDSNSYRRLSDGLWIDSDTRSSLDQPITSKRQLVDFLSTYSDACEYFSVIRKPYSGVAFSSVHDEDRLILAIHHAHFVGQFRVFCLDLVGKKTAWTKEVAIPGAEAASDGTISHQMSIITAGDSCIVLGASLSRCYIFEVGRSNGDTRPLFDSHIALANLNVPNVFSVQ